MMSSPPPPCSQRSPSVDPLWDEAQLRSQDEPERLTAGLHESSVGRAQPFTFGPELEAVTFPETGPNMVVGPAPIEVANQLQLIGTPHDTSLVNTARGSTTDLMEEGVIPTSPSSLVAAVSRPFPPSLCATPPPPPSRLSTPPAGMPRRSTRLA